MEDEASGSLDKKDLGNLRVVDLKQQLEKRGLSKSGSKKDLVKRLKQQLEFEKLCEERKGSGDYDLKLELDAATEQNEFVQQYLAQQQKRYAERKEKERIQLEDLQKLNEENLKADSEENLIAGEKAVSDSYGDSNNTNEKCPEDSNLDKNKESNSANILLLELKDKKSPELKTADQNEGDQISQIQESENNTKESNCSLFSTNEVNEVQKCHIESDSESNQKSAIINLIVHNVKFESKPSDINCDNISESAEKEVQDHVIASHAHEITEKQDSSNSENVNNNSTILVQEKDRGAVKNSTKTAQSFLNMEHESSPCEVIQENAPSLPFENLSSEISCSKNISVMESSQCSSVPYSLSDIQLPESPGSCSKSSKQGIKESNFSKAESVDSDTEQNNCSNNKIHSNGMPMPDTNSPHDASESETKSSEYDDSPRKKQNTKEESSSVSKEERDSRSDSSDRESNRNEDKLDKRNFKYEDTSSNLAPDSEEQYKESSTKERKPAKLREVSEASENDKSSDSEKYKHHHNESKHKSHDKHRKRSRRSRSRSSSSSSSDSSPKRRHSKKSSARNKKSSIKSTENSRMSEKNASENTSKRENSNKLADLSETSFSHKKRLKIKRDNVPVEKSSSNIESSTENLPSRKSTEKDVLPSTSSTPDKISDQQPTEPKEKEVSYVPRKVSLSNRKLNRKSSEDKNNEAKSKKSKWGSFASAQKTSQTISISTDSLKNWFPDFKLISESTPAMELDHDETSLSAAEEKSSTLVQPDVASGNDSDVKQEYTSNMEVEDIKPQKPDIEEASEQGLQSKIIFIQNLVRPFTLNQLKELLKQYGNLVEEYFWIDKIKSKCFVMYETEKEASKARRALNNTRWPSSNPKILIVEFSNVDELEQHKTGNEIPPKIVVEAALVEPEEMPETRASRSADEHKRKDRERRKDRDRSKPQAPVREWDKDKIVQDSPEREHVHKEEKPRSSDKKEKKESKKRANDDTPAKLLDDLFQKTKSAPCIYWLPLTEEQVKQREEEKRLRKIEREKRHQQSREQEAEHHGRGARSSRRSREKENRKSSTRSRSPVTRRR